MADLESVIVGGAIAIAGGLATQILLEYLKQRSEKRKKKAEKLEELVSLIYEHHHWIQHLYEVKVQGKTGEISLTRFAKIEAITHIYFSQFDTLVDKLAAAATTHQELMLRNAQILQQLDLSIESHGPVHTGFIEARANYLRCGNILLDELKAYAKREFNSARIRSIGFFFSR
jgi:hypothetical protein